MKLTWYLLFAGSVITVACSKTDLPAPVNNLTPTTPSASQQDLLKDSVYLYTKETYLWQELLPAYEGFTPRQYSGSTNMEIAQNVMNGARKLQPLDRFSFVTTREVSNSLQTGEDKDFGFFVKAAYADKAEPLDSAFWFVSYVYDKSTAGVAGVQRGWSVSRINGSLVPYNQAGADILNNTFFGTTDAATFEFRKPDGTITTANLSKTSFTSNSVLHREVISAGGKKIAYLVFNQFFGQPSRDELTQAFNYFTAQGANELVVDLRYNPGGSTETQDALANLIAPASANKQKMYTYIFNSTLQNNQHQLIRNKMGFGNFFSAADNTVHFEKAGTLNLSRVFFIVTGRSASASELLINNLKPYMDVKLIGEKTYGKPVGFFPIPVYDVDIYPISFKTVNSAGTADYYNGFAPDQAAPDGVSKGWGDPSEPSLAAALKFITTGSFARFATTEMEVKLKGAKQVKALNDLMDEQQFSGMFVERKMR